MSVYYKDSAEWFLQAANSMLMQTVPPSEFVLVCDGPITPELNSAILELAEAAPKLLRVVRLEENKGLGVALAIGLQACSFDLVARMDSDDIAVLNRMESQLLLLENEPSLVAVGGQIAEFTESPENVLSRRQVPLEHEEILLWVRRRNPMNHMTVTFRKSHVLEAGNYRDAPFFEDYDLWIRMLSMQMLFANIGQICVYARVNEDTFRRRGGWRYFRYIYIMEKRLLSAGLIGPARFSLNVLERFAVTCLTPNRLRSRLYRSILRTTKDTVS